MKEAGTGNFIPTQPTVTGPEMPGAPAPPIETKSQLETGRPTIDEVVKLIDGLARGARKNDYLEASAYLNVIQYAAPAGAIGLVGGAAINLLTHAFGPVGGTFCALAGFGAMVEYRRSAYARSRKMPAHWEEGYAFQCIRAQQSSSEVDAGEIVLALHPRRYPDDRQEPSSLATQRMKDALEIASRSTEIDKVILPQSAVDAVGLPFVGRRPYDEAIDEIKRDPTESPYPKTERAVVLPKAVAAEIAEMLEMDSETDPFTARVLQELATRHPAYREALTFKNEKLIGALHSILRTTLQAELSGAWRQRYDRDREVKKFDVHNDRGEKIFQPGTAKFQDDRRPLITELDTKNPYNPRIRQRKSNYETVLDTDLLKMAGGNNLFLGAIEKLNRGECSDIELTSLALRLLELKRHIDGAEDATAADAEKLDSGELPGIIRSAGVDRIAKREKVVKLAARTAVITSVLMGSLTIIADATSDNPPPTRPSALIEPEVWRYDKHDMDVPNLNEGYWTTDISYKWTPEKGWVSSLDDDAKKWHVLDIPNEIDPEMTHITLSTVTNQQPFLLPQHDALGIVAVRVTDEKGNDLKRSVLATDEGIVQVSPAIERGRIFKVSVDLGRSKGVNIVPNQPLDIEDGTGPIRDLDQFPRADEGPTAQADDMNARFTYDNSDELDARLNEKHSPQEFVREVYEVGRCNCWQCTQALAMSQAVAYPKYPMAYATGFLHDHSKDQSHGYLSIGHAWMNEGGGVTDPTPSKLDEHSEPPVEKPVSELDRQWSEAQKRIGRRPMKDGEIYDLPLKDNEGHTLPLKPIGWTLGTIAAAVIVEQEVRKRIMRNAVGRALVADRWIAAHQQLDVRQAFGLLGWAAYGRPGSMADVSHKDLRISASHPDNIPQDVLERARRGELAKQLGLGHREAMGLKRAAGAELAHRRHMARRTSSRKS